VFFVHQPFARKQEFIMQASANSFCLVYMTVANATEAECISKAVIQSRLAACANIIEGSRSFYWWEGKVQNDEECTVLFKTRKDLFTKLEEKIKPLHSYDCPCIIALPLEHGSHDFLDWIDKQTQGD